MDSAKSVDTCPTCHQEWPRHTSTLPERARRAGLTRRELQALRLIGQARTNQQIAADLGVSVNSVKSYVRTAYRRLGITSRTQAVLWVRGVDPEAEQPPTATPVADSTGDHER